MNVLETHCFKIWLECHEWIELGMTKFVGELEY